MRELRKNIKVGKKKLADWLAKHGDAVDPGLKEAAQNALDFMEKDLEGNLFEDDSVFAHRRDPSGCSHEDF